MQHGILRHAPLSLLGAAALLLAAAPRSAGAQVVTNDCFKCVSCNLPDGSPGHRVTRSRVAAGQVGLTIPEPVECGPGTCSSPQDPEVNHEVCTRPTSTAFSLPSLTRAVREGDLATAGAQLAAGGMIVELNASRQAIQVVGCTGAIVAHLPVTREQFAALQVVRSATPVTLALGGD